MPDAIDIEGRGSVHAAAHATQEILSDPSGMDVVREITAEAEHVEVDRLGIAEDVLAAQLALVLEQNIMHEPKAALPAGGLGHFCRSGRVRVDSRHGKVPEGIANMLAHVELQRLAHQVRGAAETALVVTVLDHGDGRIIRPTNVIAVRGNRRLKCDWPLIRIQIDVLHPSMGEHSL